MYRIYHIYFRSISLFLTIVCRSIFEFLFDSISYWENALFPPSFSCSLAYYTLLSASTTLLRLSENYIPHSISFSRVVACVVFRFADSVVESPETSLACSKLCQHFFYFIGLTAPSFSKNCDQHFCPLAFCSKSISPILRHVWRNLSSGSLQVLLCLFCLMNLSPFIYKWIQISLFQTWLASADLVLYTLQRFSDGSFLCFFVQLPSSHTEAVYKANEMFSISQFRTVGPFSAFSTGLSTYVLKLVMSSIQIQRIIQLLLIVSFSLPFAKSYPYFSPLTS